MRAAASTTRRRSATRPSAGRCRASSSAPRTARSRSAASTSRPAITAASRTRSWRTAGFAPATSARSRPDGRITIRGHAKEVIHVAGFNVFPAEVEGFLLTHPDVARAAVLGVPHPRRGAVLQAFVVARPGREVEPAELLRFARPRIAGYKVPYDIAGRRRAAAAGLGQARPRGAARGADGPRRIVRGRRRAGRRARRRAAVRRPRRRRRSSRSAAEMRFRSYRAGEVICREGEPGETMFVIVDGLVQVRVLDLRRRRGPRAVDLRRRPAGRQAAPRRRRSARRR